MADQTPENLSRMYKIFDTTDNVYMVVSEKNFLSRLASLKSGDTVVLMDFDISKIDLTEFFADSGMLVSSKDIK